MGNLHEHYDQLTDHEREFVDLATSDIFARRQLELASGNNPPELAGDDRGEQATDAIARWVIESRK